MASPKNWNKVKEESEHLFCYKQGFCKDRRKEKEAVWEHSKRGDRIIVRKRIPGKARGKKGKHKINITRFYRDEKGSRHSTPLKKWYNKGNFNEAKKVAVDYMRDHPEGVGLR